MTSWPPAVASVVLEPKILGSQEPRFQFAPPQVSNASGEAIDLCAQIGMPMDLWQQTSLRLMLGETASGGWSAFEFGLVVPRQNGKGGVLEARELAGLFLFGEEHIIHSAHESSTAAEAYLRMRNLIDGTDWLSKRVKKMIGSPGRQYIELHNGARLSYKTRTGGGGRGFSAPTVIFDEAQHLNAAQIAASMPLVSTFEPYAQLIYAGTVKEGARTFRGVVERGRAKLGTRLGYAEWSAPEESDPNDPAAWAQANPALGIRITQAYVQAEHDSFVAGGAEEEFKQERLSIWPPADQLGTVIPVAEWGASEMQFGTPGPGVTVEMGLGITPDREWASVGFAWMIDGKKHLDVVRRPGTDWVLSYLVDTADGREVCVDQGGPAATLLVAMGAAGLKVRLADTAAYKTACAMFVDDVKYDRIRHRGQQALTEAAVGVKEHGVGDSWVFARRDSGVPIDPLEAVNLAAWGLTPDPKEKVFFVQNLASYL